MRRLRLAAVAIAAGLAAATTINSTAATQPFDSRITFRASRIQLTGPFKPSDLGTVANPVSVTSTATVVAQVVDWNRKPRAGIAVTFAVLSGPDGKFSAKASTGSDGRAVTTITDKSRPGTDVVQATFADGLEIHKSERIFIAWQSGPPARSVSSDAQISVSPSCFQPAAAAQLTSNTFKSAKPISKLPTPPSSEPGTITVQGDEFNPFSAVLVTFDAGPGGRAQNFTAVTNAFGHFSEDISVTEPPEGVHLVRADDFRQREADTKYTVPCFMPSLALYPPIGPPGFVAEAVGTGFPANTNVTLLNWMAPDLPSPLPKITVATNKDGVFECRILVLYHDMLGPRLLQAVFQNPNGPNAGSPIEADAPFLVTLGRSQPPDFVLRR